jgi:hypothetical protein
MFTQIVFLILVCIAVNAISELDMYDDIRQHPRRMMPNCSKSPDYILGSKGRNKVPCLEGCHCQLDCDPLG